MLLQYSLMFLGAATLTFLLAFPIRSTALLLDVVDHPEKRKMHQIPMPLLGGLAIAISFGVVSFLQTSFWKQLEEPAQRSFWGLILGAAVIVAVGVYDDIRGIRPLAKLGGQVLATLVVVAAGARIDLFTNPLGSSFEIGWLGIPLTVFWIVGVTNAVNLIDGLDGLAVGIGGIAALGMFAVAAPGNPFVATFTIILAGACLGLLPHNFYPAKIFLGDTGSMFIGFCLAVIGLHGSLKATTATVLFLPIIMLGMPIFDTLLAIFRRAKRRISPFKADREHIHHRLVRIGLHHRDVVLVLYFVCVYLALTAYSIAQFPYQSAFAFVVLLTMGGIIGVRSLRFVEERLEQRLVPRFDPEPTRAVRGAAAAPGDQQVNVGGRRVEEFGAMVCEVGGFRDELTDAIQLASMCADIRSMLGRRLRVHAVVAEPLAPGHLLLVLRTQPLKPSLQAMVENGLAWYFEDQKTRYSADAAFPRIRWVRTAAIEERPSPAPRSEREGRSEPGPRPLRERRPTAVRS